MPEHETVTLWRTTGDYPSDWESGDAPPYRPIEEEEFVRASALDESVAWRKSSGDYADKLLLLLRDLEPHITFPDRAMLDRFREQMAFVVAAEMSQRTPDRGCDPSPDSPPDSCRPVALGETREGNAVPVVVGMHVLIDPDHEFGIWDYGGWAPFGGMVTGLFDDGDVLVRFYGPYEPEPGSDEVTWAFTEWSMKAAAVRPVEPLPSGPPVDGWSWPPGMEPGSDAGDNVLAAETPPPTPAREGSIPSPSGPGSGVKVKQGEDGGSDGRA